MATGDGLTTARVVGACPGIDEVHGEVKPADRNDLVARLQTEGRIVAMAGDGINDAPAMARATFGIAMSFSSASVVGNALPRKDTDLIVLDPPATEACGRIV